MLLRSSSIVTIDSMASAIGSQQHSVRGFLFGVVRKKLGLNVVSKDGEQSGVSQRNDLFAREDHGPMTPTKGTGPERQLGQRRLRRALIAIQLWTRLEVDQLYLRQAACVTANAITALRHNCTKV